MCGCITDCRDSITSFIKGIFIIVPKFPDALVQRIFFVMQVYLTNVWRISFTHAAAIMNFWEGMSLVLPPLFQLLADAVLGNFTVAVVSTIFSTVGIGMVALSVPRIINRYGGWCKIAKAESCLNDTEEALFFTGMVLTAIGRAAISFSLDALREEQTKSEHTSNSCWTTVFNWYRDFTVRTDKYVIYLIGSLIVVICIRKWKLLFGIPAIYSAYMTTFWFLSVCFWYKKTNPLKSSPLATGCKVFYAAATSKNKSQPLIQNDHNHHHPEPCFDRFPNIYSTRFMRCLDGALPPEGEGPDNTRTFDKEKVEATRFLVGMIPISITFIFCGVVSSIGNTYFVEQANHMNRMVGKWKVPLLALQLPVIYFKLCHDSYLWWFFKNKDWIRRKLKIDLPIAGIWLAMIYSVLCCIAAARMEMKRLNVIRSHNLHDKPDEQVIVPMHAAWLLFQFFLLAGLDSSLRKSIEEFYKDHAPKELESKLKENEAAKRYLAAAVDFVSGLGYLSSVLSVFVVGRLTNWFQFTLNKSRLDQYYWLLAALSAVNLVVFNLVAVGYMRKIRS